MYVKLCILLVTSVTVSLTSATNSITEVPDFQVLEGSAAPFPWKYTGTVDTAKWLDTDGTTEMMNYALGSATKVSAYDALIDFITDTDSMGMTILKTEADDTGEYKVEITFTSETLSPITGTTKLTVVTADQYEKFKMGSTLKINSKQPVNPANSIVDLIPGDVTLVSTVPTDYTQVTTCTHTSSGTKISCGDSCTETTCNFQVNSASNGDKIEVTVLLDGFEAIKAFGYTIYVKEAEKKTALGSSIKASEMFIAALVVLVWIWG